MSRLRRTWALAAMVAGVLGIALSATLGGAFGTAAATGASPSAVSAHNIVATAAQSFFCQSSVAHVTLAGQSIADPADAGSATSCPTNQSLVQQTNLLGAGSALQIGSVGPAGAYTFSTGAIGNGDPVGGTAVTDVNALTLSFPGLPGYSISIAGDIQSQATAFCGVDSKGYSTVPMLGGSSTLNAITVTTPSGSQTVNLDMGLSQLSAALGPLSALISITPNEQTFGYTNGVKTSITQSLLDVKLLANNAQILVGSSTAGFPGGNSGICAENVPTTTTNTTTVVDTVTGADGTVTTATTPGQTITGADGTVTTVTVPGATTATTIVVPSGSVPTFLQQCAPGTTLDSSTGNCVIYDNGMAVFVSKPFKGPTGGTVVLLSTARGKYHSPCLSGPGPDFVLLVTAKNGVAKGTPRSDRILGLNTGQRLIGLAGNDCIDEQKANSHVLDGNGRDRIYVSSGYNRVISGNGPNTIHGGHGRNWITDGTGNDYIYGGSRYNRIDAYGNKKHIYGGSSNDRIWTNSQIAKVSCGGGKHDILFARRYVAAYGKKHGCESVRLLH